MTNSSSSRMLLFVVGGLLIVGAVVAVVVVPWVGNRERPRGPARNEPEPEKHVPKGGETDSDGTKRGAPEAGSDIAGELPQFELIDQSGSPFGLWRLEGKVWIANCMFTRCQSTGPRQTEQLRKLQAELQDPLAADAVHLVSITVDPDYDRVEVLHAYSIQARADPEHWSFLTGSRTEIERLIRDGFRLPMPEPTADPAGPLNPSSNFVLIDPLGRVRGHYDSQRAESVSQLRDAVTAVLSERLAVPHEILAPPWMEIRSRAQRESVSTTKVFHDFQFVDRFVESGIRFRHRCVDDAGKDHKPVHYDHGNGICVADVDNDGLLDVYFSTQIGRNELWKNLGSGKFINITDRAGVALSGQISVTASFADLDNDGDADLYVTTVKHGNHLFQNDGQGNFTDTTSASGLGHVGHSSGAVFFDYNRDGLLDLFLCNVGVYTTDELTNGGYYLGLIDAFAGHLKPKERNERSLLFKNVGSNRFEDVTVQVGLHHEGWTGDASPVDINRDGWIDLYVLNMQGHDQFYENIQGQSFVSKGRELFPKTPWGSMGIGIFDFDNDADMDIFVTDMHSDMSGDISLDPRSEASLNTFFHDEKLKSQMRYPESLLQSGGMSLFGNAFYRNEGDGTFVEISDQIGTENYWPWGLSLGDFNADGFEDVLITSSMNYPFRYGVNSLLLNDHGERFVDSEFVLGIEPRRGGRTAKPWFALDCAGVDRGHKHCEGKTGQLIVWSSLGSRSSAVVDLDNDGDLDIVTNEFNDWPMVLISDLAQRKTVNFLKVKLLGTTSNCGGFGGRVEVKMGDVRLVKVLDGKSGYLSQSLMPLYFGLAQAEAVDEINIVWPSGSQQTVRGPISSGSIIEVRETGS